MSYTNNTVPTGMVCAGLAVALGAATICGKSKTVHIVAKMALPTAALAMGGMYAWSRPSIPLPTVATVNMPPTVKGPLPRR